MKRIHIVGIAFAAIFAFSMVSASGASALSLWDQCSKVTAGTGKFTTADCNVLGTGEWEWLEITAATATDSLSTTLTLTSGSISVGCVGSSDGFVGPGAQDEVTEILDVNGKVVNATNRVLCSLISGSCSTPEAEPVNLPWATELLAGGGDLLGPKGTGGDPGWKVICGGFLANTCTRHDSILTVENLLAELEVDLGFKPLEEATCSLGTGKVEGTVSTLLVNGNGLQAM